MPPHELSVLLKHVLGGAGAILPLVHDDAYLHRTADEGFGRYGLDENLGPYSIDQVMNSTSIAQYLMVAGRSGCLADIPMS